MPSASIANPPRPKNLQRLDWHNLHGAAASLAIANRVRQDEQLTVVITPDADLTWEYEEELRFFLSVPPLNRSSEENPEQDRSIAPADSSPVIPVHTFPDWETLPYDTFSPPQDIVSERLATLYRLPSLHHGVLVVSVTTAMHRLPPPEYINGHVLVIRQGDTFDLTQRREALVQSGYQVVDNVNEPGELAIRGAIIDLFPMGSMHPYRIELFDDEIESLRTFDVESQRTLDKVQAITILPGREMALDKASVHRFRDNWHQLFDVDERRCPIYQDVRQGLASGGIEYYLPLFHNQPATLFDYLPDDTLVFMVGDCHQQAERFRTETAQRYESLRHDIERPILPPDQLFLKVEELFGKLKSRPRIGIQAPNVQGSAANSAATSEPDATDSTQAKEQTFNSAPLPPLALETPSPSGHMLVSEFLAAQDRRVLFAAESAGRREVLEQLLRRHDITPEIVTDWRAFTESDAPVALITAPVDRSVLVDDFALITETDLLGRRPQQRQGRRNRKQLDPDQIIRNLTELTVGAPVVHIEHGVGRYQGLVKLEIDGDETEFLTLSYAEEAKLYVPVASLHLIARYTGADVENAPLHRLGSDQWQKARRKAAEKVRDVAAELLDIYARREARQGLQFEDPGTDLEKFAAQFDFEETADQREAIASVVADMMAPQPMDRLVCGDVGFGKTEVAMRAAFMAVANERQVAVLVPTTLLAQQHFDSFSDRFADWPVTIEILSRMRSDAEVSAVADRLREGKVDIVIGTHKILNKALRFDDLGLVIIDEEHRFGVRHKERLRQLRAEVDVLTLTATPIPRTLNMSMAGIRDISIIATPPARRLAIKTFVQQHSQSIVVESIMRELKRGGQVFYVHNEVKSINQVADRLTEWLPEARIIVGHGQMPKQELARVMADFYHRRANILVCTTIIETGIDIPNANTIVIDRADRFGLAQLHQLRGRVGRSHRQAYAYLLTPHIKALTSDAVKRLEAIEASGELGVGFTLATHDMEIRGAGELLGEDQSGQIETIGFSLYMEMLERAVNAMRDGRTPDLDQPLEDDIEINLHLPALIPDDYLPDVHMRLILYKRIANTRDADALEDLQVEMIDRFGLLPEATKNLFSVTLIKQLARKLGIHRMDIGPEKGRIEFDAQPKVDPMAIVTLVQQQPNHYRLDGGTTLRTTHDCSEAIDRIDYAQYLLHTLHAGEDTGTHTGKHRQAKTA